MQFSHSFRRFGFVFLFLLGAARPAWALGDAIVPQGIGFIVGGPVLVALFIGLVLVATKGDKADPTAQRQWEGVAILGLLFNVLCFGLLLVFDPGTWGAFDGWTEMGFGMRYALPSGALAIFLGFRGWPRRAVVLAVSCLLVGVGHFLGFTLPKSRTYEAAREQEKAAAPDGSPQKPYQQADQMPAFVGGQVALDSAIQHEIRYPNYALERGLEGAVRVAYIVLSDGSLAGVRAVEGIDAGYHEEAERVVKSLPPFLPGKQNGTPVAVAGSVNVFFTIPVPLKRARLEQLERESKFAQASSWDDSAVNTVKRQWAEKK